MSKKTLGSWTLLLSQPLSFAPDKRNNCSVVLRALLCLRRRKGRAMDMQGPF